MKYVMFEGKQYKVPAWVKCIARDLCGDITGFENKPYKNTMYGVWDSEDGRAIILSEGIYWENSLTEVD